MSLPLTASAQRAFGRMAEDLQRVFAGRFVALVAYNGDASAVFVSSVHDDDLHALTPLAESWHHDGLATPLVMTSDEFRRSLDTFPLEYHSMLTRHTVIAGTPPFDGAHLRPEDVRRACEGQARGHLIHLRQGWIQSGSHQKHLIELLVRSAAPFRSLLENIASFRGAPADTDDQLAAFAQNVVGVPSALVSAILALDTHPEQGRQALPLLGDYLKAAEQLWDFVDTWQST